MPRQRRLPDMSGINRVELMLSVLAVLESRGLTPEFRRTMNGSAQLGALLEVAGGANDVLNEALARLRRPT